MSSPNLPGRPLDRVPPRLVDPAWSVNETLRRHPGAVVVFNAFGVDACCGGARSLADAARDAYLDPADLLDALEDALPARRDGAAGLAEGAR